MSEANRTKVFYNSACPVCRAGIESQQEQMGACSLEVDWVDVHQNPEAVAEIGVDLEQVRERLYVKDERGSMHIGSDAFAQLWMQSPRQRWLGRVLRFPVIRPLAGIAYNLFARCLYRWNRKKGHW